MALGAIFLIIVLSIPFQIAILYNHGLDELMLIYNKITALNLLVMLALILNVVLLYRASPYLKVSLPATLVIVGWNNYVVGSYGSDFSLMTTTLATMSFAAACVPLLAQKETRLLLKHPEKRWWLTPKRYKRKLRTQIQPYVGQNIEVSTLDISETGLFVPYQCFQGQSKSGNEEFGDFKIGEMASLQIRLSEFRYIKCDAEVVRLNAHSDSYPAGMGMKFINLDSKSRRSLRSHLCHELN